MKKINYSYLFVLLIILLLGGYVFFKTTKQDKSSLYIHKKVPDFEFINQDGKKITNQYYKGKVFIVEFFFATCPTICPLMNKEMVKVQNEFISEANFGIASISITPDIDTPQKLKDYAKAFEIKHQNWNLLTGKPAKYVYDLSNNGFKLRAGKTGNEEHSGFEHSGLFALIDKKGRIRSRYDKNGDPIIYYKALEEQGEPNQIEELKEDIKILLKEE